MTLAAGRRLGLFEVIAPLGAGGMGEVYRARDERLGREVAIKVLPEAFAANADRLSRFEREARMLAALNHSGIAAIHGLEQSDDVRFLVLELVEGKTLAERLDRGALPQREALEIARQIAEALEAAHEKGIVHRDLKPSNIKLTPGGKVKLLDFGLAKALGSEAPDAASHSPTETEAPTHEGAVLGTAPYMSPEQARGEPVDKRTDVWAFGCVLFEMLTGRRAFGGATTSDTIASVLTAEPDWKALPSEAGATIRTLLRRCLTRDLAHRLHDLGDARLEIEEALGEPAVGAPRAGPRAGRAWAAGLLVAGAAFGALVAGSVQSRRHEPSSVPAWFPKRLEVGFPPEAPLGSGGLGGDLAFSPDGRSFVYSTKSPEGRLWSRRMDQLTPMPIPGTEHGDEPFFSPDGRWLGFFSDGKLRKVSLTGGQPITLCDAPYSAGGSWGPDDVIVFAPQQAGGLWRVPAAGGAPQSVTTPDTPEADSHRFPQVLPGGKAAMFSIMTASGREAERAVAVVSLETGRFKVLVHGATFGRYSASGHLLYGRSGTFYAAPFDVARLELTAPAIPVLEDVRMRSKNSGGASLDISATGMLAYVPGYQRPVDAELLWVDRTGHPTPLVAPRRPYSGPALSPDGRKLAVTIEGESNDVWVGDLGTSTWTRLTFHADNESPVWSPDGRRIAFDSNRDGAYSLFWQPADGSGAAERLTTSLHDWQTPHSFTPDGGELLFLVDNGSSLDVDVVSVRPDSKPRRVLREPFSEVQARLSPDGRWLAYVSDETGRQEVYVRPYPGLEPKRPVSSLGGEMPHWSRDGRELFLLTGMTMTAVSVRTVPSLSLGRPQALFDASPYDKWYDIGPDGRFVMVKAPATPEAPAQVVVIPDWFAELNAKFSGKPSAPAP